MTETQTLIARMKAQAKAQGISPSTLSFRILGSGGTYAALKAGKTITLAKYERAMALLDEMERGKAA